jgi:hypothetical protein
LGPSGFDDLDYFTQRHLTDECRFYSAAPAQDFFRDRATCCVAVGFATTQIPSEAMPPLTLLMRPRKPRSHDWTKVPAAGSRHRAEFIPSNLAIHNSGIQERQNVFPNV